MKAPFLILFLIVFISCDVSNKKNDVSMNYRDRSDAELQKLVIYKGDTDAYYDLSVSYLDYSSEKFLPYAIIMANKYDYPQAYFDVYDRLWYLYNSPNLLDNTSKKMAIEYLQKAALKGHTQAIEELNKLQISSLH